MASLINDEEFSRILKRELNAQMLEAAEPIIKQAIASAETEMRKRLASILVSLVDRSYRMERMGHDLVVRVDMGKPAGNSTEETKR